MGTESPVDSSDGTSASGSASASMPHRRFQPFGMRPSASGLGSLELALLIAIHTTSIGTGDERRTQGVFAVFGGDQARWGAAASSSVPMTSHRCSPTGGSVKSGTMNSSTPAST